MKLTFEIEEPEPIGFTLVYLADGLEFREPTVMTYDKAIQLAELVKGGLEDAYARHIWVEPIYESDYFEDSY